jgi:F0F1-type ATP synthase delta subunit
VSDAVVDSAFAIERAQLADVVAALEKRFGASSMRTWSSIPS